MIGINLLFLFGWITFWVYWLAMAAKAKRNISHTGLRSFWGRLLICLLAILIIRLTPSYPLHPHSSNFYVQIIGLGIFFLGLGLAIWARIYLGRNWGMPMSKKENPELVTNGPYRLIRHPIYVGILLATIGIAIGTTTYWLGVFIILGIYFFYSAKIEEKTMATAFPKTYPGYKRKTKMLIPYLF